jgi:hypothetical protein
VLQCRTEYIIITFSTEMFYIKDCVLILLENNQIEAIETCIEFTKEEIEKNKMDKHTSITIKNLNILQSIINKPHKILIFS